MEQKENIEETGSQVFSHSNDWGREKKGFAKLAWFCFCSRMHRGGPLPIGSLHASDFADLRQQRTLAELAADDQGFVRFKCLKCPRRGQVPLAELRARFRPSDGLVSILNELAPPDCPLAGADPWGNHPCGFCYRDLARRP